MRGKNKKSLAAEIDVFLEVDKEALKWPKSGSKKTRGSGALSSEETRDNS